MTERVTVYAVLGWPVAHSRSPQMLDAAFGAMGMSAIALPIAVPPEKLAAAVAGLFGMGMIGASVTLPHKIAVKAVCDELSPAAREISAVNCLHRDGARLIGHNTDCDGFVDALDAAGIDLRTQRIVLLGAGGAARGIAYGVRDAPALDVIARRPDEVTWARAWPWTSDKLRECFARADLVVDCTPTGLDPAADAALADSLPLDALPTAARVVTLVYHRRTNLLERASARGHATLDGRAMLVHQGARAFTIWTGRPAPIDVMTRALDDAMKI